MGRGQGTLGDLKRFFFKSSFWQSLRRWHLFQKEDSPLLSHQTGSHGNWPSHRPCGHAWPLQRVLCPWLVSLAALETNKAGPDIRVLCIFITENAWMQPRQKTVDFKQEGFFVEGHTWFTSAQELIKKMEAGFPSCHLGRGPRLHLLIGILRCHRGWASCHSSLQEHLRLAGCQEHSSPRTSRPEIQPFRKQMHRIS
jgi:hypothetical protein